MFDFGKNFRSQKGSRFDSLMFLVIKQEKSFAFRVIKKAKKAFRAQKGPLWFIPVL